MFIKDLMQDIKNVPAIKDGDEEHLMVYYMMLQSHIAEAPNAELLDMLLIPANVEMMVFPLSTWEKRVWKETQGMLSAKEHFVEDWLAYATNMVATSERHVLPKPIPLHRPQRSPSLDGQGGWYSRGSSKGRNAWVMATMESWSADRKQVRFLPPKAWDDEAKWTR